MDMKSLMNYYKAPAYVTPDNKIISPICISSLYQARNRTNEFIHIVKITLSTFYVICKQPILWLFNRYNMLITLLCLIILFISMLSYCNYKVQKEREIQYKEEIKALKTRIANGISNEKIIIMNNRRDIAHYV